MRPGTLLRWHALKRTLKSEIKNNSTVLDIGSYDGFASGKLTEIYSNLNIILVDLDMSGLVKAKQKNLYAIYGSALNLPVGDSTVDVVLCLDLIEHIDDDSNSKKGEEVIIPDDPVLISFEGGKDQKG